MISAVSRAFQILEALSDEPRGCTLTQLVTALEIEKSVASRILATLEQDGYVTRDPVGDVFQVTIRFAAIALRHIERMGIHDVSLPILEQLAHRTDELIQLAVLSGGRLIYVAKAIGSRRVQVLPLIGTEAYLHASVAGKLWLASLPEDDAIARAVKVGLRRLTRATITGQTALRAEIRRVRREGYAVVERELSDDMNAIGVTVAHARTTAMIGAVILAAPAYRSSRQELATRLPDLRRAAAALSEVLTMVGMYRSGADSGLEMMAVV